MWHIKLSMCCTLSSKIISLTPGCLLIHHRNKKLGHLSLNVSLSIMTTNDGINDSCHNRKKSHSEHCNDFFLLPSFQTQNNKQSSSLRFFFFFFFPPKHTRTQCSLQGYRKTSLGTFPKCLATGLERETSVKVCVFVCDTSSSVMHLLHALKWVGWVEGCWCGRGAVLLNLHFMLCVADIISALEFSHDGEHLATGGCVGCCMYACIHTQCAIYIRLFVSTHTLYAGDKGGRVVVFERSLENGVS